MTKRIVFGYVTFVLVMFVASGSMLSHASAGRAITQSAEHPVPLEAKTPAATCLGCHSALQKGKSYTLRWQGDAPVATRSTPKTA